MKLTTLTGIALSISTVAAYAQSSIDQITAQLQSEGFANIEVEVKDGTIEVEGTRAGQERELVFDATTWELLKDETHADLEADDDDSSDDHDDDSSDDHDDHDEDEADDDNDDDADESDDDDDEDDDDDQDDD